jgi:hypothetical protein
MIFRAGEKSEYVGACRYTGYVARSIQLTLECGHTHTRKRTNQFVAKHGDEKCRKMFEVLRTRDKRKRR